ncbi:NAD-dependent dehydratase [Kocuria soli]|uniref:NAD-dependent dehydratase n=1 Tax=Kocuria soli TaxID=2485125 RepID=A0A3N3ZUY2_9MICC|nr:NAD-dependent epimerase/dehydratase family protein [Kocuria soli]ROZ64289.1 NAD-dependent dehydratase [Kocuria soli]
MTHHLILAGCGDLGTELGRRMTQKGWQATGVRRSTDKLPESVVPIGMDLTNPGDRALPHADAVVITLTARAREIDEYRSTYIGALHGLRSALDKGGSNPQRVLLVSSTAVLGDPDGQTLTEDATPNPQRPTAKVLLEAEHLAQELFPNVSIIRPAGIYGPGRSSFIGRVRNGEPMNHRKITNRIHRDDLVTVLERVLEADRPPSLLHAVDTEPAPMGDVAAYVAGLLNVPVPPDKPGGPQGKALDSARMQELVGILRYPTYREGYSALLT